MSGPIMPRVAPFLMLAVLAGCATKQKQRIALLEETNANLTQRLNAARAEVEAGARDRDELDRRLQAALAEAESLKAKLAEAPSRQLTAPGWTAVPGGAMIAIEGSVLFAPGKAVLRREAQRTLDAIVSAVQGEYADKDILVVGHTDDRPIKKSGWADNYQLSTERSLAVVRYLRDHGVAPSRLIAGGGGEHRPRVANDSRANRAVNRRVEFFAIEPLPQRGAP